MNGKDRPDQDLAQHAIDAAAWCVSLKEGKNGDAEVDAWLAWMQADPRHAQSFIEMADLCEDLGRLDEVSHRSLVMEFASPASTVRTKPAGARRWMKLTAAAAILGSLLVGGLYFSPRVERQDYASAHGRNEQIALSDGSRIALGASSRLEVRFSADERGIDLKDGEAHFSVAHNSRRPFIVDAGKITVRAVGTAFDVRRVGDRVTVTVTEGRVRIGSRGSLLGRKAPEVVEAGAGQQVIYDPESASIRVADVGSRAMPGWLGGNTTLEFVGEPLHAVVVAINRYSQRPVRIADARAARFVYTGTVRMDRLDSWAHGLQSAFPLHADETPGGIVISAAADESGQQR